MPRHADGIHSAHAEFVSDLNDTLSCFPQCSISLKINDQFSDFMASFFILAKMYIIVQGIFSLSHVS